MRTTVLSAALSLFALPAIAADEAAQFVVIKG
jgi:hypothetical protein